MLLRGGPVADNSLAPPVKDVTPGIAVARRYKVAHLERCGIDDVRARTVPVPERSPGRLDGGGHRYAFEHVQEATVRPFVSANGVMRVVRSPPIAPVYNFIRPIVIVRVLQE